MGFAVALCAGEAQRACPLSVVLGGALWALSNYGVLPLVKLLGIGLGFSLYHFVNLIVGYVVGRFGIFGVKPLQGNIPVCDFGCFLILISFIVMVFVEEGADHEPPLEADGGEAPAADGEPVSMSAPLFEGVDQEYRRQYHQFRLGEAK